MDERALGLELERDLLRAAATGKILYLEGASDVMMLFGLLGSAPPDVVPEEGLPLEGIWVRGLSASTGSGSKAVEQRVHVAAKYTLPGVHGIIDGDGRDYDLLARTFDPPFMGPLHTWKGYCLENLLVQCGWPEEWGTAPDWRAVLAAYVPYAALNRVVASARDQWFSLEIARSGKPVKNRPRRTAADIRTRLRQDASTIRGLGDVATDFDAEVERCEAAIAAALPQSHALINGKWLVEVDAAEITRLSPEQCRQVWARHAGRIGGHPEVVAWWRRLVAA